VNNCGPHPNSLFKYLGNPPALQIVVERNSFSDKGLARIDVNGLLWFAGSGKEFIRDFNIRTPVLFYSGAGYDTDKEAARLAGAQGYLVKPVEADVFIAEVAKLIEQSKVVKPVALIVNA